MRRCGFAPLKIMARSLQSGLKFITIPVRSNAPKEFLAGGFTIIEVMVALAIVGISLGVFMSILGNSLRMRWKLEDHAKNIVTARVTAEKFRLGLLEDQKEGETEDGKQWTITPIEVKGRKETDEHGNLLGDEDSTEIFGYEDKSPKKIDFYNVVVEGVEVSSSVKGIKR